MRKKQKIYIIKPNEKEKPKKKAKKRSQISKSKQMQFESRTGVNILKKMQICKKKNIHLGGKFQRIIDIEQQEVKGEMSSGSGVGVQTEQ